MYRLISTIDSHNYGASTFGYQGMYSSHQQSRPGQSNQLLLKFYQSGIQVLILLLIQQQLQSLLDAANTDEQQSTSQNQGQSGESAPPSQHCHCPCGTPVTPAPETTQPPVEEAAEEEQENDEYALIMENIRQLQQLIAQQNMIYSYTGYSNYIARHQNDQQIIHSVQMSGGRILETTDEFFVAEDANQVRYFIQRS